MNTIGFILTYRNLKSHWLWQDAKKFLRWTDLVMDAAWEPTTSIFGNSRVMLERGQLVTSIRTLMHQWGTNSRYVSDFLDLLESERMIVCESTKAYTIITIVGYDEQQRGLGNGYNDKNPPPSFVGAERKRLHQESREGSQNKENNNIINNTSFLSIEEENLKFVEIIKNDEELMMRAASALKVETEKILQLLEMFKDENIFISRRHTDFSNFKAHFINWSRNLFNKDTSNGTGQQKGKSKQGRDADSQSKYDPRRGTPAGNHTSKDYGSSF